MAYDEETREEVRSIREDAPRVESGIATTASDSIKGEAWTILATGFALTFIVFPLPFLNRIFSALTTISGIGSIAFARHNGVATFGVVLLLGISLCLLTALFVLPALIDLLSSWGRKGEAS